jgi:uncharacterized protein
MRSIPKGLSLRLKSAAALLVVLLASAGIPNPAPVADAARKGDRDAVRALIASGGDVNAALGDGMTALHWAAVHGDAEMAGLLLGAGASVEVETRLGGYTPLHLAAQTGETAVVAALLDAGSAVSRGTETGGVTALHFAAQTVHAGTVQLLVDRGADVNAREVRWGQTPLMFAAVSGNAEVIRTLLRGGADPSLSARVIDMVAREQSDQVDAQNRTRRMRGEAVDATPRAGAAPMPAVMTPEELVRQANPELVDPLSYAGQVHAYGGLTALLLATREGHREAVAALLDAGAALDQASAGDGNTPLLVALINGHFDLAVDLLDRGADYRQDNLGGVTPLYAVINNRWAPKSRHPQPTHSLQQETGYLQLMERLLKMGADPNVRVRVTPWYDTYGDDYLGVDRGGATPFWRAAYATDVAAMRLLMEHGADPNVPTLRPPERRRGPAGGAERADPSGLAPIPPGGPGVWPIHAASGVGYGEGFAANVHQHVPNGWMPAVRYLVEELGADVNARDHNGFTPLHHAAARGDNEMIMYLVEKGADVTAVARRGQTTADMANGPVQRISPFLETVALLERLGSKNNNNCVSC